MRLGLSAIAYPASTHLTRVPEQRENQLQTSKGQISGKSSGLFPSLPITALDRHAGQPMDTGLLHLEQHVVERSSNLGTIGGIEFGFGAISGPVNEIYWANRKPWGLQWQG